MSKGKIIYVKGNVCEPQKQSDNEFVVIPHCCNNLGVMGAGVALSLTKKWPEIASNYMASMREYPKGLKNWLGEVFFEHTKDENICVANMIGQDGTVNEDNPKPVKYWALLKAMQETLMLAGIAVTAGKQIVFHCPKFGSDLAGGKWELIEELIKETWCERGFDVVIYEFECNPDKWGPIDPIEILKKKANEGDCTAQALLRDRHRENDWWKDEEKDENLDGNWTAELKPITEPLLVTVDGYASMPVGEQLWLLKARFSLSEKEVREIRTDDIYGLPYPIASDFEGFEESKYPVI